MKKLTKDEMLEINGGTTASYTSSAFLTSVYKLGSLILEIGRTIGSSARRIYEKNICSL